MEETQVIAGAPLFVSILSERMEESQRRVVHLISQLTQSGIILSSLGDVVRAIRERQRREREEREERESPSTDMRTNTETRLSHKQLTIEMNTLITICTVHGVLPEQIEEDRKRKEEEERRQREEEEEERRRREEEERKKREDEERKKRGGEERKKRGGEEKKKKEEEEKKKREGEERKKRR